MRAIALLFAGFAAIADSAAWAQTRANTTLVTIGTGLSTGTYYPVGRALCRIIDRELRSENIRCSAESTSGSVYNVRFMQSGEFDFAIVQADVQFAAINGQGPWAGKSYPELRSVLSLYDETFAVVVAPESGIRGIDDLRGRVVNVGAAGSGTRATWSALAGALNWEGGDRVRAVDIRDVSPALCSRNVEATLHVAFHPASAVQSQLAACETRLVPVRGAAVEAMLRKLPYYQPVRIPAAAYGLGADIESFGVSSDLVTSTRIDPRIVTLLLRAVLANLDELAAQSPALAGLKPDRIVTRKPVTSLHPAAAEIYRGLGLVR